MRASGSTLSPDTWLEAMTLRDAWDRTVTGPLLERSMRGVVPLRAELLMSAHGRTIEIGFGTGANLLFYPSAVTELVVVEPSLGLIERARDRLRAWGRPHTVLTHSATNTLPLDAHSFDTVVMTFVLCSVPDVQAVLAEAARLLKPKAPLLLAEHVAAQRLPWRWMQRAARPFSRAVAGCDPTRETASIMSALGWDTHGLHSQKLDLLPPVHTGLVGVAYPPNASHHV